MLFSNTLEVKAASSYSFSTTFYPSSYGSATYGIGSNTSGYLSNGTGNISTSTGSVSTVVGESYCYHVTVPFFYTAAWTSIGGTSNYFDNAASYFTLRVNNFTITSSSGNVSNVCLYDSQHNLVVANGGDYYLTKKGASLRSSSGSDFNLGLILEYDVSYADYYYSGSGTTDPESWTSTFNFTLNVWGRGAYAEEISAAITEVTDNAANQSLDAIEQSSQQIATSVTSETGGGLLATIKNFFGGFFSNLINSILGLFVPDSTYFSTWFDNLNTLLSAKLGMLYAPFDLLISTLNAVYSADTTEPGITFPGITWDGQTVIEPYTFYFSSLGEDFQNLRDAVYFATDVVFLFAFLHLLQKKIALVITGSEVNG